MLTIKTIYMKSTFKIGAVALLALSIFATSCNDDNESDSTKTEAYDFTETLNTYVDNTVITTYGSMKDKSIVLFDLVEDFKASGSQEDLNKACQQWRNVRIPWEQSESFLFGPAAYQSLDPLLDSWPLDQAQLDQVLAGNQTITADYVRDGLGAVLRGFHTVEYLLFREGNPRTAANITAREKEYLVAVTEVLRDDCIKLWVLWHGDDNITGVEAEVVESLEISAGKGYGNEFKNAGKTGSRYVSQKDAVDEIIQGCLDIADEVANGKLADPFNTKDPLLVESWYSWNSLDDFKNNIKSIEISFFGGANKEGVALISYFDKKDATISTKLQAKIDAANTALGNIPEPFRNNLDKATEIQAAIDAINELNDFISSEVKPLIE